MTEPQVETRKRPRRRGCLIVGCLVPTVLVVVLGVVAFTFGRAYVRDRIAEWRADQPLVDLALRVTDSGSGAAPLEAVRGDQDPAHLPDDVVVVPGADPVVNITEDSVTVYQETREKKDQVSQQLRSQLSGSGWELVEEADVPGGQETVWSGPTRICTYQVVDGVLARTEVWIRCLASSGS